MLGVCLADKELNVRAKVLAHVTQRWFSCDTATDAAEIVHEVCAVFAEMLAKRGAAVLALSADEPLMQLLRAVLLGDSAAKATHEAKTAVRVKQSRKVHIACVLATLFKGCCKVFAETHLCAHLRANWLCIVAHATSRVWW